MRKVEEFKETQELMDEFKKIEDKVPEIDNQINDINTRTNLTIERLEDEMNTSWEDVEFDLDKDSVKQEYEKRINEVKKDKEKEKDKPKSTADQKEEKKASAKTPHAKDYTKVDIKKASGTKVTDFETDRIDGGKLSQGYFSGGTITLVNVWSTT